jgi:hypothetical protein
VCDRADVGPVGVPVAGDATTLGESSDAALPRAGGGVDSAQKQKLLAIPDFIWLPMPCEIRWLIPDPQPDQLCPFIVETLDSST